MARIRSIKPETPQARWRRADLSLAYNEWGLYRLYAADGSLLYVGITGDPIERWRKHASRKPWWPQVARITLDLLPTRAQAAAAELEAIRSEAPAYNRAGVV